MTESITSSHITFDPKHDEYALYLVEDGPWKDSEFLHNRLLEIQDRIFSAIDVALEGHMAKTCPSSIGKKVRIQVDALSGMPEKLEQLIRKISKFISESSDYQQAVEKSISVKELRIVSGKGMGRFE